MVEQRTEDVVLHREAAFDHYEEHEREDTRRHPFMDWRLNISHVLSLIGAVGAGLFAFLSLGHEVELNKLEARGRLALLKSEIQSTDSGLNARIAALEDKSSMRTSERQDADAAIRQDLKDIKAEMARHAQQDDRRFKGADR